MKVVQEVKLIGCGAYLASKDWQDTRASVYKAIGNVEWPVGSGLFTIYPESGKKRGEGWA